jgi:hypothetical protein
MSLNLELLRKHIQAWQEKLAKDPIKAELDRQERASRTAFYSSYTIEKIRAMSEEDFYEYIAKLWAMLIWGNKKYAIDKLIRENGFEAIKAELADLVWGQSTIEERWDRFRSAIKGIGPAMMSEILSHSHPGEYILWNRRAYVGLNYLGVDDLPAYSYQVTGKRYRRLCDIALEVTAELRNQGISDANLLTLDYFIWSELQVADNLSQIHAKPPTIEIPSGATSTGESATAVEFLHNDIRDKVAEIGEFLNFETKTEVKIAAGAVVDAAWESRIGNLGRVIYVFEVQTKGSIDGLILNLLKSLNNPAVQGIVAVSDLAQIEQIKKEVASVRTLHDKLRFWDYQDVLRVHEALVIANESINKLDLLPQSILGV